MRSILFLFWIFTLGSCSQHKVKQLATNKVVEKKNIILGNEEQYVEIIGENDKNPVLLFVHGGPGWPQIPMLRYFNSSVTNKFTLACWDQRGCGLSYIQNNNPSNVTLEQIVQDAHELTIYLQKKFNQKKIYLAGFSWGSIIGMHLAQKYPQDYEAYISISQVVNLIEGMKVSQQWLKEQAAKANDDITLKTLQKFGDTSFCKNNLECFMKQYELVNRYKGAIYSDSAANKEERAMTAYADYKNYDWNKGFEFSVSYLAKDMFAADFTQLTKLDIPVYFLLGKHDWNVPAVLTEQLAMRINAPTKEIIWFNNSAHNLLQEEPEVFNHVLSTKILRQ